jgi:hypothetical protein
MPQALQDLDETNEELRGGIWGRYAYQHDKKNNFFFSDFQTLKYIQMYYCRRQMHSNFDRELLHNIIFSNITSCYCYYTNDADWATWYE